MILTIISHQIKNCVTNVSKKGPIGTSEKTVYLDQFSVITNALQIQMVCRDLTNFVQDGQMFKGTANKIWSK